jgi:hypothetical protein
MSELNNRAVKTFLAHSGTKRARVAGTGLENNHDNYAASAAAAAGAEYDSDDPIKIRKRMKHIENDSEPPSDSSDDTEDDDDNDNDDNEKTDEDIDNDDDNDIDNEYIPPPPPPTRTQNQQNQQNQQTTQTTQNPPSLPSIVQRNTTYALPHAVLHTLRTLQDNRNHINIIANTNHGTAIAAGRYINLTDNNHHNNNHAPHPTTTIAAGVGVGVGTGTAAGTAADDDGMQSGDEEEAINERERAAELERKQREEEDEKERKRQEEEKEKLKKKSVPIDFDQDMEAFLGPHSPDDEYSFIDEKMEKKENLDQNKIWKDWNNLWSKYGQPGVTKRLLIETIEKYYNKFYKRIQKRRYTRRAIAKDLERKATVGSQLGDMQQYLYHAFCLGKNKAATLDPKTNQISLNVNVHKFVTSTIKQYSLLDKHLKFYSGSGGGTAISI